MKKEVLPSPTYTPKKKGQRAKRIELKARYYF